MQSASKSSFRPCGLLFFALLLLVGRTDAADGLSLLTNVAQVKRLSSDDANRRYPVQLHGVITYVNPATQMAFLQDKTGGTFFVADHSTGAPKLIRGQSLIITGETARGEFAPFVAGKNNEPVAVTAVQAGQLPEPRHLLLHESANPVNHSEWVEIVGVVRGFTHVTNAGGSVEIDFDMSTARGRFQAIVQEPQDEPFQPEGLLGAVLRMRGVYGSVFNRHRKLIGIRLLVQEHSDIRIDDPGTDHFHEIPIRKITSILRFEPGTALRLRVQGVVTKQESGRGFYLQDLGGWLWIETPQPGDLPPGTRVDVVGFPSSGEGFPLLQDSVVTVIGKGNVGIPMSLLPEQALAGKFHGALATLRGIVVDRLMQPGNQNVLVKSGDIFFRVRLSGEPDQPMVSLPDTYSIVEATGICVNEFRRLPISDPEKSPEYGSVSFHLGIRSTDDIKVIEPPPFWTFERVAWLLAALGLALFLALAWIRALRKRVVVQTAVIHEKLERETVMEERTRIARELHDTLEQELSGVQMQLDAVSGHLRDEPEAASKTLDMARALLRHSRDETKRSVWDLRSAALESGDLARAFRELFHLLYPNSEPTIAIKITGQPRRLPPVAENNFLRIAQEAVNNAIEHGKATRIDLTLDYDRANITLRVMDNGSGFDPDHVPSSRDGHFGLTGMRERANKLKARLTISSAPGEPTVIELVFPSPTTSDSDPAA